MALSPRPVARALARRGRVTSIEVTRADGGFDVRVQDDGGATQHRVQVPAAYLEELGLQDVPHRELVEESFRFLLEREPKESIMRSFELPVIERYFGEYPDEIRRRLGG